MMNPAALGFLFVLSFASMRTIVAGKHTYRLYKDNEESTKVATFAFNQNGFVEVHVSNLTVFSPEEVTSPDLFSMGVYMTGKTDVSSSSSNGSTSNEDHFCLLTSPNVVKLFTFLDMKRALSTGVHPDFSFQAPAHLEGPVDVFFANCAAPSRMVSAVMKLELSNRKANGQKVYLPAGSEPLPIIFAAMAMAYAAIAGAWLWHLARNKLLWCPPRFRLPFFTFLGVLFAVMAIYRVLESIQYFALSISGSSPSALSSAAALFYVLEIVFLLLTYVTGLSPLEPYLTTLERTLLLMCVPTLLLAQLLNRFLPVPGSSIEWQDCVNLFHWLTGAAESLAWLILLSLVALGVIVWLCTLPWSLSKKKDAFSMGAGDDRKTLLENPFARFYTPLVLYVISVEGLVLLLRQRLPYSLEWVAVFAREGLIFLGFVLLLFRCRPRAETSVYQLFDETDSFDEELDNL
eukprot:TRINITY_DN39378_c0_g1_i1.p1 TRINITY_DN39378_c0_g1~~TRINITY_DN39378_c0_g1_i1.p1  ORF type:complete len:460 (+),score=53.12 TRINITY_DN39378_c0_g1_i1:466-1845(+)